MYMFMYVCVYTELMTISISLVNLTMMDLWENKSNNWMNELKWITVVHAVIEFWMGNSHSTFCFYGNNTKNEHKSHVWILKKLHVIDYLLQTEYIERRGYCFCWSKIWQHCIWKLIECCAIHKESKALYHICIRCI